MPRNARDIPPDSITHLIDRGVERRSIFQRPEDYRVFLSMMRDAFRAHLISVLNFALMPNHFHIQALNGQRPVGGAMHQLLTRYSVYFNRIYERVGPLFQGRYKSFVCRDDAYLVQLPVYITRNPVRAGLVQNPADWEWSGHNELASGRTRYLDLSRLQEVSGMPAEEWRASYLALLAQGVPELSPEASLHDILNVSAQISGISLRDLQAGHRGPPFTQAKRHFVREARRRGFLQTAMAAVLGCSPVTVAELLANSE